jgi:hypothetical protein
MVDRWFGQPTHALDPLSSQRGGHMTRPAVLVLTALTGLTAFTALTGLAMLPGEGVAQQAASRSAAPDVDPRSDVLFSWNALVLTTAEAEDGFLTLKGLRTAAMLHLAAHDALNAIEPRYEAWAPVPQDAGGDPVAAVAQAAYHVAIDQYPDQQSAFEAELRRWLDTVADEPARGLGVSTGEAAAERILASREGDGWNNEAEYRWHPMGPGVYAEFAEHSGTPAGFVFGAGWATARPFALDEPDHFVSPPPPDVTSEAYAKAYAEVKSIGAHQSSARTPDQTHIAMWWKEFVESSHNRLARELAAQDNLDLWDAARMLALLEVSIYDGYVSVFHNKFLYNHWRPYTAIRWAAHDGNPDTQPDPDWTNTHGHTYAFPTYPSAHGTVCAAAMTVLASVFGEDRPFTMTIPEVDAAGPFSEKVAMDPAARDFDNFSAAAHECALSRVYLGIHFRYDSLEGERLGKRIGEYVVRERLRPR